VYSKPSPDVITGTTIESTVYNTFVGDVETDLNLPRPVSSGGTGATSPDGALVNVSGEKAAQLVTSYDTHLWMPGSFRSAAAAAGAPNGTAAFAGIAYINEALANPPTNQNVVLEARDLTDGMRYVRRKTAGVWGAWDTERSTIYAAPFDAMAYNGMQINGSMEIDQPNVGAALAVGVGTVGQQYLLDGWYVTKSGTNTFGVQQTASIFPGLLKELKLTITTAQSVIGTDIIDFRHSIEGYRIIRLGWGTAAALPITIGFWVRSSVAGTLPIRVISGDFGTVALVNATITTVGVPQYVTVTIPAQTTGAWNLTNGTGMLVSIRPASSAGINIASINGNTFEISGFVVLPGTQAPTAAQSPLIMRPYDQELVTCKRYFYVLGEGTFTTNTLGTGHYFSAAQLNLPVQHPVQMRAAPTLGVTGGASFFSVSRNGGSEVFNSFASSALSPTSALIYSGGMAGTAGQAGWVFCNNAAAKVSFDARL